MLDRVVLMLISYSWSIYQDYVRCQDWVKLVSPKESFKYLKIGNNYGEKYKASIRDIEEDKQMEKYAFSALMKESILKRFSLNH